jgi:site-specific DNA recombinase
MIILQDGEMLTTEQLQELIGKILAIVYARVSTADQAKHGYSLDSQIEKCVAKAKEKHKVKDDEIIVLVEAGGMGDDPNRPALNYGLYLLEKGLGKTFVILHPDRLTRDNTLQGVVSRRIWNLGVDLEFVEFQVDPNDPESMLMYNIQGSIAQYNKAKIHANSKRGRIQKAKKGEIPAFKRMFGYSYNKDTDKLEINEEEQEVFNLIVDMLLKENLSCNQIAKELSKRGISAPLKNAWYQNTITRMLRNESYCGTYYYGKTKVVQQEGKKIQVPKPKEEWIAISIPPLLDLSTFQLIQDKIDEFTKNKGRKSTDYILKGIAKCGRCGSAAGSGITSKVKSGVYKYYACRKKASKAYEVGTGHNVHTCTGKNWRVDIVDEFVWATIEKLLGNPKQIANMLMDMSSDTEKINTLASTKIKIEAKLKEIANEETSYIMLFGKGKISEQQLDQLTEPLKENKLAIEEDLKIVINQINTLNKSQEEVDLIEGYLRKIKELFKKEVSSTEKRNIAKMLIEKVLLHEDDTIEIVWKFGVNDSENKHKKQNHVQAYGGQTT